MYLANAAFAIPFGKVGDMIGQVKLCYILITIQLLIQLGCIFATNFYLYLVLKFVWGVAVAGAIASRNAMTRKYSRPKDVSKNLLLHNIIFEMQGIICPLISGIIIDKNWRILHILNAATNGVVLLTLIPFKNPRTLSQKQKFDFLGIFLLLIGVTGVNLSFTLISASMYIVGPVLLVVGILCLLILAWHENRFANPVLPMKILKNPVVEYAIIYILIYYISSGVNYLIPQNF